MSHDHAAPAEEYNPARDYARIMAWVKYGAIIFAVSTLALRFLIG